MSIQILSELITISPGRSNSSLSFLTIRTIKRDVVIIIEFENAITTTANTNDINQSFKSTSESVSSQSFS